MQAATLPKRYHVTCQPPGLVVSEPDTIINFQLIHPTPQAIKFVSLTKIKPLPSMQLSVPSISLDGKLMTLCDANTVQEPIAITFHFSDNEHQFTFDPQIQHNPR